MINLTGCSSCRSPLLYRSDGVKRIDVIPMPNKITYLGGETKINPEKLAATVSDSLEQEEYVLTADKNGVQILGGSEKAVFYAKQTLLQLGEVCPCVKIEDKPAFAHRGFMLDTVRHIFSVEDTKKLIDAAASVKMNVMHWHLTDDQGFRIYSSRRPDAALKGSVRKSSDFGRLKESGEYGGYFTADEMKEIVDYCAERYITVIPEFDIPGHSSALLHAFPQLSCKGEEVEVKTSQGIYEDILCAGNDETLDVVFDILSDILEIFPSEYIHIGGDEAPKARWKECPHCQERMKKEGLKDEETLQGWFTNQVVEFLKTKGRKAVVWNESLKSGVVDGSVTVQMWMDKKKLSVDFANDGGRMINSDFIHYYCDYPYGMTPLIKTYNYNPVDKKIKDKSSVIGVEAPIWTEYINSFEHLCHMFFPRVTAVAETGWTYETNKNAADFQRRFMAYSDILKKIGIIPAPPEEWNPSLFDRLTKTVSFFTGVMKRNN